MSRNNFNNVNSMNKNIQEYQEKLNKLDVKNIIKNIELEFFFFYSYLPTQKKNCKKNWFEIFFFPFYYFFSVGKII
jgi:hypothetical protein